MLFECFSNGQKYSQHKESPCEVAGKNDTCEAEFPFQMQRKENILHCTDLVHNYMKIY